MDRSDAHGSRTVVELVLDESDVPPEVAAADAAKALESFGFKVIEDVPDASEAMKWGSVFHHDPVREIDSGVEIVGGVVRMDDSGREGLGAFIRHLALSRSDLKIRVFGVDVPGNRITGGRVFEIDPQPGPEPEPEPPAEAADAAQRLVHQLTSSMAALAPALAAKEGLAVSPQLAFALAQEEKDLRAIESDFGWLDSGGVAEQLGRKPSRTLASSMRAKGKLLGYVRRGQQAFRYPKFQFDGTGVVPVIPELIALADERRIAHEDLLFWLCSPTGMLDDDARPVDLLRKDPEAVLAAARYDLRGNSW